MLSFFLNSLRGAGQRIIGLGSKKGNCCGPILFLSFCSPNLCPQGLLTHPAWLGERQPEERGGATALSLSWALDLNPAVPPANFVVQYVCRGRGEKSGYGRMWILEIWESKTRLLLTFSLKIGYVHVWLFNVKSGGCSCLEWNGSKFVGFEEVKKLWWKGLHKTSHDMRMIPAYRGLRRVSQCNWQRWWEGKVGAVHLVQRRTFKNYLRMEI